MPVGFFPCFSQYIHKECPLAEIFDEASYIRRVKDLMSALIDSKSPQELHHNIGSHGVSPIRPDSRDGKKIIGMIGFPETLLKIDYGNNPFRIYLGLSSVDRMAYIFLIDTKHRYFNS